jgi:threonine/homoserine/homoserine lactone efflux protein
MSGSWGSELTEMIPLALVITLSPVSIIPAVLVLLGPGGKASGLAYLFGWLVGLCALTAVFVGVSGLIGDFGHPPKWASWARIVIGSALIAFGVWRWVRRNRVAPSPAWMRALSNAMPARAAGTGVLLTVVNPKVLLICAAAGFAAGSAGLGLAGTWGIAAFFVVVASLSVATPVLAYAVSGDRLMLYKGIHAVA